MGNDFLNYMDFSPMIIMPVRLVSGGRVLDLGMGDGKNALFFARAGYEVEGVDISEDDIKKCLEKAEKEKLKIKTYREDIRTFNISEKKYSIIIASNVLYAFGRSEGEKIICRIKKGLKENGIIYLETFSLEDANYKDIKTISGVEMTEKNSFYHPLRDRYACFYTKNEILSLFSDFRSLYCADIECLDMGHGEPHSHGTILYIGQKI